MRESRVSLVVALAFAVVAVFGAVAPATAAAGAGADADAAGAAPVDCSFPVTVTDASGTEVTLSETPERVVVAGPSAAQTMWAIGAQDKVVGMPNNYATAYLDGREGIPNVVNARMQPVQEKIVNATPDLVLAPNVVQNDTVESLRNAGLTVYRFHEAITLSDVYAKTELTGRLVGEFEAAAGVSAEMEGQVSAVREAVADEEPKKVFYNLGGGWTVRPDTFIGDIISTAGGENIAEGRLDRRYAPLPSEEILVEDPDWILTTHGLELPKNTGINESTAVEQDQIVTVDTNFLNQPGPRNVEPLAQLASALHPEAMADVNLDDVSTPEPEQCTGAMATDTPSNGTDTTDAPTPTPTATPEMNGTVGSPTFQDANGTDTPTTGDGGPGFTVGAALVAALVGTLLVRRRR